MGEWISVEDMLPEDDCKCICVYKFEKSCCGNTMTFVGTLDFYRTCDKPHFQHEGYEGLKVIYWMPLPEPPKYFTETNYGN